MNKITIENNKSIYEIYDVEYKEIKIDGKFSSEYFSELLKDEGIKGLVPPYSGWTINKKDEQFVKELLNQKGVVICPILICPDDQDFTCTTVVVEIVKIDAIIKWNRVGYDVGYKYPEFETIGKVVDWKKEMKIEFLPEEYNRVIESIRRATAST